MGKRDDVACTEGKKLRVGVLSSHPIQYQVPWFRRLAEETDVKVFFAHRPNAAEQGQGFGRAFKWDLDLLSNYSHEFLRNVSRKPGTSHFSGCDTPDISTRIRERRYDAFIVNGWYLKCYWQAVAACRNNGIPVLVRGDSQLMTPRSKLKEWIKEIAYRQMLKRFNGFLAVGLRNAEYLRHYGVQDEKIFPAPHFIDNAWFATNVARNHGITRALKNNWQASDRDLVILFVGKFIAEKRATDLLRAVAALPEHIPCRLVFVGSGVEESKLRLLAAELGLVPAFPGFKNQSELPSYYAAADVVVLPSGSETWGLVINEAMACGSPAIVSDACGCAPDLIDEGKTGFTFPVGNVDALAKCLFKMAEMKHAGYDWRPALSRKMEKYSVTACTAGTLDAVRNVIAKTDKLPPSHVED